MGLAIRVVPRQGGTGLVYEKQGNVLPLFRDVPRLDAVEDPLPGGRDEDRERDFESLVGRDDAVVPKTNDGPEGIEGQIPVVAGGAIEFLGIRVKDVDVARAGFEVPPFGARLGPGEAVPELVRACDDLVVP